MNQQNTENKFEFLKGDKVLWMVIIVISVFQFSRFTPQVPIWNILLTTEQPQDTS